ncbi:MAG: YggT family protein [Polyangiales bacterium]
MISFIAFTLQALQLVVFADVVLSWIMPSKESFPRSLTSQITDPLYAPIRAVLKPERSGGLDFSPMIMLLLLQFMARMLSQRLGGL